MTNRRDFLQYLGLMVLTPFTIIDSPLFAAALTPNRSSQDFIFSLSIASGDPSPRGVVLWTRINPEAIEDKNEPLYFEVSKDQAFKAIVHTGRIAAEALSAQRDFTVAVDLSLEKEAQLSPYTSYYYRFIYKQVASRIGHCKTLPEANQKIDQLRFVQITCQDYSSGYYHAFDHIAKEENIDFVVHLGDFIYEYAQFPALETSPRKINLPQKTALTLEDFRSVYRQYREDPSLQRAMEAHTWIITTDDHETANNCYWDHANDTLGLPAHHHILSEASSEAKIALKMASQRAWMEYVPARVSFDPNATHPWKYLRIYRKFQFGSLAELYMTDTRSYRSDSSIDKSGSMLGPEQKEWMLSGMKASSAHWQIWGNQSLFSQFGLLERLSGKNLTLLAGRDAWDGYPEERRYLLETLKGNLAGRLLILTGDMHTYMSSYAKIDYNQSSNDDHENVMGLELMTPSVTSPFFAELLAIRARISEQEGHLGVKERAYRIVSKLYRQGKFREELLDKQFKLANPHIADFGAIYNGYTVVVLGESQVDWQIYHVDRLANTLAEAEKVPVRKQSYDLKTRKISDKV